jgi:SAM-dependent methyltransferase
MSAKPHQHDSMTDAEFARATDGTRIHGDDFVGDQIAAWYADEAEGYSGLFYEQTDQKYPYFAINEYHAWSRLPKGLAFGHVLGIGAAHGDELAPIANRAEHVTILDPSSAFTRPAVHGVPATYVKPSPDGTMAFADNTFDLVTCFATLHHVCTVSKVLAELGRVTKPGGWMLLREPVVSMGDWRKPRQGLTKRERGIPPALLCQRVQDAGFQIVRRAWCISPVVIKPLNRLVGNAYNSPLACRIDGAVSRVLSLNHRYHAKSFVGKLRPVAICIVARKPS